MDSIDDRMHGAERYVKRWEPQEGSPTDDVIDALVEAFQDPEMRRGARWCDGRPVFPPGRRGSRTGGKTIPSDECPKCRNLVEEHENKCEECGMELE